MKNLHGRYVPKQLCAVQRYSHLGSWGRFVAPLNIFEDSETLSERDWNISGDKWLLERPVTDSTEYEAVDESNVSLGW